jgi:endogenous inhibitor of DNA gyrase (YacG/DUF329 family)
MLRAVMGKPRSAPCPRCSKRAALDASNGWRPFCSERCKMIDLGKWAAEEFAIPAEEDLPSSDAPEEQRKH